MAAVFGVGGLLAQWSGWVNSRGSRMVEHIAILHHLLSSVRDSIARSVVISRIGCRPDIEPTQTQTSSISTHRV